MAEGLNFSNPNEELEYLRSQVLEKERALERFGATPVRHEVIRDSIKSFEQHSTPNIKAEAHSDAEKLLTSHREIELEEIMKLTESKGVLHSLHVVEKLKGWRLEDDFHDFLIGLVARGMPLPGIKEKGPVFQALHMSLIEVVLPKLDNNEKPLAELIKSMEQLYAGLLSIASGKKNETDYMVFEIANPDGVEDTRAFVSVPSDRLDLFKRQMLAIFPNARLIDREKDYNIFNELGSTLGATARLTSPSAFPLKTFEAFGEDPLNVILNGFSHIPTSGAGAALQIVFKPKGNDYTEKYQKALKKILKGEKPKDVLKEESLGMELAGALASLVISKKKDDDKQEPIDQGIVEAINKKLESPIVETNIRLTVSTASEVETKHIMHNLQSAFNQFENSGKQSFRWEDVKASKESDFYRAFTFRLFRESDALPLNTKELSTILHFHTDALSANSSLKQDSSKAAPPPQNLVTAGTLLGINSYQGRDMPIYMAPEDRLRHLYVIGQTGTGKTSLLKNMIIEDIKRGDGACFIDPHGSDIQDILGLIPPERMQDVIYFDPAYVERPMALNMLEYDRRFPEQKTFVVNEMLGIFNKLFDMKTSGGPMFEQYFRNAVLLTIDDPDTGATLVDVSRVLSSKEFRALKLSRCTNPLVVQFWKEVAEKAGGESSLANMVPYIVSKFDNFLSNDIMRPVIAQEHSSFNFREIMDNKKILLVNLSKGRLGEMNANLIGLILVGKILMAALSRADSQGVLFPNFYLYIDEFQNISTDSISSILSEARKYKLSLNLAHQFIAQLEPSIKDAVFGNVGSMAIFRVGSEDAEFLEKQLSPTFTAKDIQNIDNYNAYIKLLAGGIPQTPFNFKLIPPVKPNLENVNILKKMSYLKYGGDRTKIEKEIMKKYEKTPEKTPLQELM